MTYKNFILPLVIVGVVMGAVAMGMILSSDESSEGVVLSANILNEDNRAGNPEAKIQLIEYADFQCPACASYDPMIKRLMEEHGSWINFAYRHLPLTEIHKNAMKSSYAAESAALQGKFWEMKELLYKKQYEWSGMIDPMPKFVQYAESLGLDLNQFLADMDSDQVAVKVDSDQKTARQAGFNSTPTFIVNGEKISNQPTYEKFVELLKQKLNP